MFPTSLSYFLLLILSALPLSRALVNITIDDRDPRISYIPPSSWFLDEGVNADYGGAHMRTEDPNAYATVTLKFVSFYVLAAKWPYSVTTDIEVDGGIHVLVDMKDYDSDDVGSGLSTVSYSVVASWIGTTSAEHTLRISIPENGEYAIVDGLIFEAPDNDINVTTSITSSSTTASTTSFSTSNLSDPSSSAATTPAKGGPSDSRSSSSSHSKHLGIIIGVISAVLAIILIFLVWWFCIRRRGRRNETDTPFTGGADTPPIDSNDQDGYDGYGYPSSPRMVQPAAAYPAVPRTSRNRAGRRVQSLAPSSRQDGLASVAQSVIGGRPPMGYA